MNFIKCLLVVTLFAVTGTNVMATDPYDALGGKAGDFNTVSGRLGLVAIGRATEGLFELTLDTATYNKIRSVEADQFTKKQNFNGTKNLLLAGNTVELVKSIYDALEIAAVDGSGLTEPEKAARLWLSTASEADRKITLNLAKRGSLADLITDNAAVKKDLETRVKWDLLVGRDRIPGRDTAALLTELNGTQGALRPATQGADQFPNAQAAYDAWHAASGGRKDYEAAKDVLVKAEGLRFGSNKRTLKYLADKEKRTFTTAEVRAARQRAVAKAGAGGLSAEEQVSVEFYRLLLVAFEAGSFAGIASLPEARGLDLDNAEEVFKTKTNAQKLLALLVAAGEDHKKLTLENLDLKHKREEAASKAADMSTKSKPAGDSNDPVNPDGFSLFDDD